MFKLHFLTRIVGIIVVAVFSYYLIGCNKYKPPGSTLELSQTITHAEAVSILNDNITNMPITALIEGHSFVNNQDKKSKAKFINDGFVFSNFFKAGKWLGGYKYEKVRFDPGIVKYDEIVVITVPRGRYGKLCSSNANDRFFFRLGYNNSVFYCLCLTNEEKTFAALLKLMPNADFRLMQQ